jgi:hypothetical protein
MRETEHRAARGLHPKVRLALRLPLKLWDALRDAASATGLPLAIIVERALHAEAQATFMACVERKLRGHVLRRRRTRRRPIRPGNVLCTVKVSPGVIADLRDFADATGWTTGWTRAALAERGLRRELQRLQREHNGGKPFPRRTVELRRGRPASDCLPLIEDWMKHPRHVMALTDLGGRTPEQASAQIRAVAWRNRHRWRGLRLSTLVVDGQLYVSALKPSDPSLQQRRREQRIEEWKRRFEEAHRERERALRSKMRG